MIISAAKASEAADALGVELTGLTPNALSKAYRNKTKECHPDYHGAAKLQLWARVSWAKECLEQWLQHHPEEQSEPVTGVRGNCRACGGTGRVDVLQRAFQKPLTMQCVMCRGLGELIPDEDDHD